MSQSANPSTPDVNAAMVRIESHFSARVVEIFFDSGFQINSSDHLNTLKTAWMAELKKWHSPYTCLFDVRQLSVDASQKPAFDRLIKFFGQFHMKKILGFSEAPVENDVWPFEVIVGYEAATQQTGLGREGGLKRNLEDLRSRISIDNDFNAHVMEISFLAPTRLETAADVLTLKSKVTNILRQWHSPYSVLFNCVNMTMSAEAFAAFGPFERFLKAFFCKQVLGYAPKDDKDKYPFKTFRARHAAAGALDHEGLQSGAVANCSTKGKQM